MKMNLKKILIAGTVLTALCANAFAAEEAQAPQPTMKERVAAILHHEDERPCPPSGEFRGRHHRGPRLTDEQRAERQKLEEHDSRATRAGDRKNPQGMPGSARQACAGKHEEANPGAKSRG